LISNSPLIKRIKRHIIGPLHNFFIVTLPGFENLCKKELETLQLDISEINTMEGGVEFTGKLFDCYMSNMHLRTANRVLMRIAEFNVTNFRKLEKRLEGIPWELHLKEETIPGVIVTTKRSRLYHSDAISDCVSKSIDERKKTSPFFSDSDNNIQPRKSQNIQNIFIRMMNDHITISLDSSGDLLYKRGIKHHAGSAPIRETLAAAALLKSGYTGAEPLFDPMCGTGTFSIEAAMITRHIPPGWYRQFAFESWPGFKPAQWAYLKKQTEKEIKKNPDSPGIVACDKNPKSCKSLSNILKKYNLESTIKVLNDDFFRFTPEEIHKITGHEGPGLVIVNPPYGIRLETKKDSKKLFIKITDRLADIFTGWKFALFSPEKDLIEKCRLKGEQIIIDHGGIKLTLFTGTIPGGNKNAYQDGTG
jgi:putative N6-adenine-specific DNA methylase